MPPPHLFFTIGSGLLALGLVVFIPTYFTNVHMFVASNSYLPVTGTLIDRSTEKCTFLYCPRDCGSFFPFWDGYRSVFVFEYALHGNTQNGTAFGTTRAAFFQQDIANSQMNSRAVGANFTLFYDPDHPHRVVFERGFDSCAVFQLITISVVGGLFMLAGVIMLIFGIQRAVVEARFAQAQAGYQSIAQTDD